MTHLLSCRVGGVNELLAIILMAKKFNGWRQLSILYPTYLKSNSRVVPVCPHAGGVGLCEHVQHLAMWDYVSVSATLENRFEIYG